MRIAVGVGRRSIGRAAGRGKNCAGGVNQRGGDFMFAFRNVMRTLLAACCLALLLSNVAHAQKWSRAAAFPEPAEELYGIGAGGKFYVFGGIAPGWKPKGLVYEYDPANDTWTKKNNMPLASHHVALAEMNGKI